MLKDFSGTLYDLFGGLFPGLFALAALALATWAFFYPTHIAVLDGYDATIVTAIVGVGYVFGHIIQAMARALEEKLGVEEEPLQKFARDNGALLRAIKERIDLQLKRQSQDEPDEGQPNQDKAHQVKLDQDVIVEDVIVEDVIVEDVIVEEVIVEDMTVEEVIVEDMTDQDESDEDKFGPEMTVKTYQKICDRANAVAGITGDHDIYLYRKDFYRGMFLSMVLLAAVLLIVAARGTLTVKLSGTQLLLDPHASFVWFILCAGGASFLWKRYTYFCKLSVEESFLTFAAKQLVGAPDGDE